MGGTRGDASRGPDDEVSVGRSSVNSRKPTGLTLTRTPQQRKERGRLAQRAFRQRQIDTIAKLEASNSAMQEAIASVTRAAALVDNPELSRAVENALHVAGLNAGQAANPPEEARAGRKSAKRHGATADGKPHMQASPSRSEPERVSRPFPAETHAPDWWSQATPSRDAKL